MVILYTSDLHGIKNHYRDLFAAARYNNVDVVIIGGDMLPKRGPLQFSLQEQESFIVDFLEPQLGNFLSICNYLFNFA